MPDPMVPLLLLMQVALAASLASTGLRTGWLVGVYAPTVPYHWIMALADVAIPFFCVYLATAVACRGAGSWRWLEAAVWSRAAMVPLVGVVAGLRPLVVSGLQIDPDRFPNLLRVDQASVGTWLAVILWVAATMLCVGMHAWAMGEACAPARLSAGRFLLAFAGAAVLSQLLVSGVLKLAG